MLTRGLLSMVCSHPDVRGSKEMAVKLAFISATVISACMAPSVSLGQSASSESEAASVSIADAIKKIDARAEEVRKQWQVPGLSVAIVKDDVVQLAKGYGTKQVDTDNSVDEHTLFAIASNSKAFTAAALAILVDEGKIDWDDRVQQHLPWFRLSDPLATRELRVRDLLCHRSGLGTFSGDLVWWGTDYGPRELIERARHLEPASSFRSAYGYSNLMFVTAGLVIEEVSGHSWSAFVEEKILSRLKMDRTITSVRDLVTTGNFATPHKTTTEGSQPIEWVEWDTMAAAGGILSSASDMSLWLRAQLRNGKLGDKSELFSEQQSREMWKPHTIIPISTGYQKRFPSTHFRAYGLGWSMSDYHGRKVIGHGGGYDGMYSRVLMVPEENLGVVVLTNSMTGISSSLAQEIIDILLLGEPSRDWNAEGLESQEQGLKARAERVEKATRSVAEQSTPSHPLEDYAGTFNSALYGDVDVEYEGESLVIRFEPNSRLVGDLKHLHYDTFAIHWRQDFAWFDEGTVTFHANPRGEFIEIELDVPNDDLWFYELELLREPSDR